ncbi:circularly permuted type 2 ATP-grasp protein [Halanaerobaculum tunisiense]
MVQVSSKYHSILQQAEKKYYQDYQKLHTKLEDSYAYYQGQVIPFLYQPLFFSQQEINEFQNLVATFNGILDKVVTQYLTDQEFRAAFGFSRQLEELILVDPGYSCNLPMERLDIFYYGSEDFKFCELNADGSSGMVKTNTLEEYFLTQSQVVTELQADYDFTYCELLDSWVDTLLENYQEFSDGAINPQVAILDFAGCGMRSEFNFFKEELATRGLEARIVDPREVEYKNGNLYAEDFRIDLIYRRAVTTDLMDYYEQISDFLAAYKNHDVCVVGPFRSQIIHNKVLFSILHDQEQVSFLSAREQQFVKQYIPYTATVDPSDQEQLEYIVNNQKELVLKPHDSYGSQGVVIGADVSQSTWEDKVFAIEQEDYLIQEFCPLPEIDLATFKEGQVEIKPYKYTLGLFAYNQSFQGIYTRAGQENVIASATGCVTLPNLVVDDAEVKNE